MKSIRIIPRLDIKGPQVVKGIQNEGLRIVGAPKELALKYFKEGVDEIVYMDIVASLYERNLDFDQLKSVCENIFIPITVGGGIRSLTDINNALRAGADKVAINTFAVRNPSFLKEAAHNFGSQCIVLSADAKQIGQNKWEVYVEGGRERTGMDVVEWIKRAISLGVGEILLGSIDHDGMLNGYDIDLIQKVTEFSHVPVIAHGGAGKPDHVVSAIVDGKADAVSGSSMYHYGTYTISDVKKSLHTAGLFTRLL